MNDLWPNFSHNEIEINNAIEMLREQARALEKKTENKVKATFSKIEYSKYYANISALGGTLLSAWPLPDQEEIRDDEIQKKKDINDLYNTSKYKFEIYNDKYRFRLFTLNYREMYPIDLVLDEGIQSEMSESSNCNFNVAASNSELKSILTSIFSSNKVKTVIGRMMNEKNN